MQILYNIVVSLAEVLIPLVALFSDKIGLFYRGRKQTFDILKTNISPDDKVIWMHCASLGEFEQGRPVLEQIKKRYPKYKLLLSFFSPSGYEVRKNYQGADVIVYLPLDSRKNAKRFLDLAHPDLVFFVKYEFWPNILQELNKRAIKTLLISGIFRKDQVFFKQKNKWFQKSLKAFSHFFVQNNESKNLLASIGLFNTSLTGDTRFDRVNSLVNQRQELPLIQTFAKNKQVLVAGSTWPKDEVLLLNYINEEAGENEVFIIAPHNINNEEIQKFKTNCNKKTVLYSKVKDRETTDAQVIIIDSIGMLTSVYAYADVAYVGGGFGAGIHNILEPATYGVPVVIGSNYRKFQEAIKLVNLQGCFVVQTQDTLNKLLVKFRENKDFTLKAGKITRKYIEENTGASNLILQYIENLL